MHLVHRVGSCRVTDEPSCYPLIRARADESKCIFATIYEYSTLTVTNQTEHNLGTGLDQHIITIELADEVHA